MCFLSDAPKVCCSDVYKYLKFNVLPIKLCICVLSSILFSHTTLNKNIKFGKRTTNLIVLKFGMFYCCNWMKKTYKRYCSSQRWYQSGIQIPKQHCYIMQVSIQLWELKGIHTYRRPTVPPFVFGLVFWFKSNAS